MTVTRSPASDTKRGSRIAVPADNVCASCHTPRGNVRKGWEPITIGGRVAGWTCPACPTYAEPIRREVKTDGSVRFLAAVRDGRRQLVRRRFGTLESARAWVAEVRAGAVRTPSYRDPSALTVRQLADRWLARREQEVGTPGGIRRCSLNGYRSALSSLLDEIGGRRAREVTPDETESALVKLATEGGKRGPAAVAQVVGLRVGRSQARL